MASLSLRNICKQSRRETGTIENFNLEIDDQEFVVLTGPSGSGKSAILRMIAGIDSVSSGEILMDSRRIDQTPAKERGVAIVSSSRALNGFMTVRKNIAAGLKGMGLSAGEIEHRVRGAAELLEIEDILDRKPKALSEREVQRALLAGALAKQPKVLLMDMRLSDLDSRARSRLRTRIAQLHKKVRMTIVMVTNDYAEAMTMGTRVVVMRDGKIQQNDTPQNLYDFPENLFVASFVGEPEMNLVKVRLQVMGSEGVCAMLGDSRIKVPAGKLQRFTSDTYIGREVYMGARPENIHDEDAFLSVSEDSTIEVDVDHVEPLGVQTHLYLRADGLEKQFVARVDPRSTAHPGDRIHVAFDANRLHFFDAETEKSILMRI